MQAKRNTSNQAFVALVDLHVPTSTLNKSSTSSSTTASTALSNCSSSSIIDNVNDPFDGQERQYLLMSNRVGTSSNKCNSNSNSSTNDSNTIFELQNLAHSKSKDYSSFFVGSRVISNPSLHIMNRIDPLYLLLPYFEQKQQQQKKWQPWHQICQSKNINAGIVQAISTNMRQLRHFFHLNKSLVDDDDDDDDDDNDNNGNIKDDKDDDDTNEMILYKFSDELVLKWLHAKLENVKSHLQTQFLWKRQQEDKIDLKNKDNDDIGCEGDGDGNGAFSSSFVLSEQHSHNSKRQDKNDIDNGNGNDDKHDNKNDQKLNTKPSSNTLQLTTMEKTKILHSATQIICEYLSCTWRQKLLSSLDLKDYHLQKSILKKRIKDNRDNDKKRKEKEQMSISISSPDTATPADASATTSTSHQVTPLRIPLPKMSEADKLLHYMSGGGAHDGENVIGATETKKKSNIQNSKSVGLKRLQKVNTKGMKSMTSFFGPPSKKKKIKLNK